MGFNRNARTAATGLLWAGLGLAVLGSSGCASAGRALGIAKATPDEFRVVTKAPLVLPPDYALRPPAPGEPRPQELQPESQARAALLGQDAAAARSQGEMLLASKAGAERADPLIRYVVDDEFGDVAHKEKSFVDKLMSWRGEPHPRASNATDAQRAQAVDTNASGANEAAPLDPAAEAERAAKLTGGKTVIISRGGGRGIKLPGL